MTASPKVRTCLWFAEGGEEAARFYTSLLSDSRVEHSFSPDPSAPPLVIDFTLAGTPYQILNGGPEYRLNEAASISVLTEDQEETDRLWEALTADGGAPVRCGWLKDRFGVSWQIVPRRLPELLSDPDAGKAGRVMAAMMEMVKIDIAALDAAAQPN